MSATKYYWIRLKSDFFDLETIDWLISQKNGCEYVVLYQKLCLLTANKNGELATQIGDMIVPYDAQKIARDTKFSIDTVIVALELFKQIGLIYEQGDGIFKIPYVGEIVGSETEYARKKREYRKRLEEAKVPRLEGESGDIDEDNERTLSDKSIEIRDRDKSIDKDKEKDNKIDYKAIVDAFNEICTSFPTCKALSDARRKAIKARINSGYTYDDFVTMFKKAQASDFLKGKNERNWSANFDWLIKDTNMAKVLDGNFDNRGTKTGSGNGAEGYKIPGLIEL